MADLPAANGRPAAHRSAGKCRRFTAAVGVAALWAGVCLAVSTVTAGSAAALDNGLARTPYMGWNTYFGVGGAPQGTLTEQAVEQAADALVATGLRDAGYRIVWLDGGWFSGERDADGNQVGNRTRFPDGMKAVADYIHSKGMLAGIYTDAGTNGCGGPGLGSYGHYQQDADQFAAWGYDAVKIDFCGGHQQGLVPKDAYTQFSDAIQHNSSHRPMIINLCNPGAGRFDTWSYAPPIANSWRTDADIGTFHNIPWSRVVRNLDSDAAHPEAAGPGHWNDPDYLGPDMGMTATEGQAQFDMWAMLSAPLIIGTDVRTLSQPTIDMLSNPEVIAIDQDTTGGQGTLLSGAGAEQQVWVKTLANGERAVALFNRGDSAQLISTTAAALGLPAAPAYSLRDVVRHHTTSTSGRIAADVPSHGAVLFRVTPRRNVDLTVAPAAVAGPPGAVQFPDGLSVVQPGQDNTVTSTIENDSPATLMRDVHVTLQAPDGWTVEAIPPPTDDKLITPGGSRTYSWHVIPSPNATGTAQLQVTAAYSYGAGPQARTDTITSTALVQVQALTAPDSSMYLSDLPWVYATSTFDTVHRDITYYNTPLSLHGQTYAKGLWANSVAHIDYYLAGRCTALASDLGIDDAARGTGTIQYVVLADDAEIYRSPVITNTTPTLSLRLDVTGARTITVEIADGGDGSKFDNADLAGANLTCAS